jgi:TRAP-type C4-dicarboxylate transport system permease small subunit
MGTFVYRLCRLTARFGALVVGALAVLSAASIAGRALSGVGLGPVPGDFELVEAGTALAVFCCLPWCYLVGGHATVDMFWHRFPAPMQRGIAVFTSALMLLVWVVLTWRMGVATADYRASGEVSFILQMPVWWGYAASLPAAAIGCVAYAWRLLEDLGLAEQPAGFSIAGAAH